MRGFWRGQKRNTSLLQAETRGAETNEKTNSTDFIVLEIMALVVTLLFAMVIAAKTGYIKAE